MSNERKNNQIRFEPSASEWSSQDLPHLPRFLETLIERAKAQLDLKKILVFGSRARGDQRAQSDYDLCFFLTTTRNWSEFVLDQKDRAETLCPLDLVNFTEASKDMAQEILSHGVCIYDSEKN